MHPNKKLFVYGLVDPRTNATCYVGLSTQGMKRPVQHWTPYYMCIESNKHKKHWLQELLDLSLVVEKVRASLKGRKLAAQTCERMRDSARQRFRKPFVDLTTGTQYDTQSDAARELGLFPNQICLVLNGKAKHTGGHRFQYVGTEHAL